MLNVNTSVSVDTVDSITLDKVRGLRDLLNSSAMDIMYYTSPLYRDEVKLYSHFLKIHLIVGVQINCLFALKCILTDFFAKCVDH